MGDFFVVASHVKGDSVFLCGMGSICAFDSRTFA